MPQLYSRRDYGGVVCGKVEGAFLILSGLDDGEGVRGTGDYASVGMDDLGANEGRAAAALEYVEIDTLTAQRQAVLLHFSSHLHGVPPYRQTCHVEGEIGVGGAAARHGM